MNYNQCKHPWTTPIELKVISAHSPLPRSHLMPFYSLHSHLYFYFYHCRLDFSVLELNINWYTTYSILFPIWFVSLKIIFVSLKIIRSYLFFIATWYFNKWIYNNFISLVYGHLGIELVWLRFYEYSYNVSFIFIIPPISWVFSFVFHFVFSKRITFWHGSPTS